MFSFGQKEQKYGLTQHLEKDEILTVIDKGKKKKINLDTLENIIILLRRHPNTKINNLTGKLKKSYQQLVRYVDLLYGTEHYPLLVDLIHKHFSKYKNPVPGTIAGYAYGCNTNVKNIDSKCSSLCAGSIKMSNDSDFCDYPVIHATYENDKFRFDMADGIGSSHVSFVHVQYSTLGAFPGFDEREKNHLRRHDYQKIYLYGFVGNGKYINLYHGRPDCNSDNTINIDNIKSRIGTVEHKLNKNGFNTFNLNTSLFFVLAIIIILLLAFFIYKYMRKKNE